MTNALTDFLRNIPMLSELPDHDLDDLVDECSAVDLAAGEVLFEEGAVGNAAYVVQHGTIEILKLSGGREVLLSELKSGDVFGEMALLDDSPRMAGARAKGPTTVITIRKSQVQSLLDKSRAAQNAMFSMVVERLKSTEAQLRQSERMVQLGTMAAGIAHELNNPAAAAKRAADQIESAVTAYGDAYSEFAATNPDEGTIARAKELIAESQVRALEENGLDPFEQSDAEAEVGDWLEDRGVADSWNVSCDLVAAGYGKSNLEEWAEQHSEGTSAQLAKLVASAVSVATLLHTVSQATGRVSNIVEALKSYSFLDQAPIQRVNVADGINSALSLLSSKLPKGISVDQSYEPDLPEIDAYGSELNQVWTNLINNAIDAIGDSGEIQIAAKAAEGGGIVVAITDSGHGIPAEITHRVFDAFFTTREPGKGTGLGLHAAYDIVVNKHSGALTFDSEPGRTTFTVKLPPTQREG